MIIAVTKITGGVSVIKDNDLNDEEKYFVGSFSHLLKDNIEYTLLEYVNLVINFYKSKKVYLLINKVMFEYNGDKNFISDQWINNA